MRREQNLDHPIHDFIMLEKEKGGPVTIHTARTVAKMTDDQLDEEIRNAYDRWTWDTGSDRDRKALEMLENERKHRRDEGYRVESVKTSHGKSTIKRVPIE